MAEGQMLPMQALPLRGISGWRAPCRRRLHQYILLSAGRHELQGFG